MVAGIAAETRKSRYHSRLFAYLAMDTMTENDYLTAWGLYAFAALGCLLVWWRMTRWIWRWLREPLALHLFNLVMALLLVGSTVPILLEIWHDLKG